MISAATENKIQKIELLAMDVDGVLTDGKVMYGSNILDAIYFNVQDGSSIKWLHRAGIKTAIITGRESEAVQARARLLGIEYVYQGAKKKLPAYEQLKSDTGLPDISIGYIGDDLPDLPVLRTAGIAIAVANACPEVKEAADIVTERAGGDGAVREVAIMLLKAQNKWNEVTARYFQQESD